MRSAMVMLTLFVGVVSTAMDQAGDDAKAIAALEKKANSFGKDNGIRPGVLRRYRATFALLDLDGSASLDADEIKQAFVEIGVVERTFELADWLQELKEKASCAVLGPI